MKKKKYFCGLICLVLILAMPIVANAAVSRAKVVKAYSTFLAKSQLKFRDNIYVNTKDVRFALAQIDNDSIPELVILYSKGCRASGWGAIYRYANGKVKRIATPCFADAKEIGYYRWKGIIKDSSYIAGVGPFTSFLRLKNGKVSRLQLTHSIRTNVSPWLETYSYNGKSCTQARYSYYLKKYVGTTKKSLFRFHKNTSANRKKYLI